MTAADRISAVLVLLAGAFAALQCAARGSWTGAGIAALLAIGALVAQVASWTRSSRNGRCVLERDVAGRLWWQVPGRAPVEARLGPATRVLGRSLLLDVEPAVRGLFRRRRDWFTPFDLPEAALRRWTVVLPSSGHETCS